MLESLFLALFTMGFTDEGKKDDQALKGKEQ